MRDRALTHPEELQDAFEAVCMNERFARYRDFEPVLGRAARAVCAGWVPVIPAAPPRAKQRAGYLLELLAGSGGSAVAQVTANGVREAVPFYHADPVPEQCYDALALRWGLTRGVNVARLRQLLTPPFAA